MHINHFFDYLVARFQETDRENDRTRKEVKHYGYSNITYKRARHHFS